MKRFSDGDEFRKEEKKKCAERKVLRDLSVKDGWGGGGGRHTGGTRTDMSHSVAAQKQLFLFFLSGAELSPDRLSNCRGALWVALTNTLEASPRNIHLAPSASLIYPADSLITLPRGATGRSVLLRARPCVHK